MHVLMVNLGYPPNVIGGAELMVQTLARELVRAGVRVSVVSLSQCATDWHYDDAGVSAYFINAHPMGNLLLDARRTLSQKIAWHVLGEFNIWSTQKLSAIVATLRPDVVHTQNLIGLSVGIWGVARAANIPVVHTLQDYQLLCPRGTMFRRGRSCARQCRACRIFTARRRAASVVPEVVVGITNFVLTMHQTHGYFPRAESAVISNSFRPPSQAPRTHTQHPRTPLRIGFIGRFHPTKGVELLLRALKGLPVGSYVAKLAGTGSPDYEARLRSLARGLAIAFLGWVPREEFYEQIDVLVVPSLYCEPQGMVLIEAASLGVPVIYSDRGGLGETGAAFPGFRSFDPSRPERLAEVLLPLIECPSAVNSLQESIGAVPASFEIDGIVGEYQQLYESVRAGRTAS